MRISFATAWDRMLLNINRDSVDLDRLTTEIGSGKRLLEPSDDPAAWSQKVEMKQGLRELQTFKDNVDFGIGWNQAVEDALNRASDLLMRAKEVGMGAVKLVDAEERSAKVDELQQIFEEALGVMNEQYGELYLFSGKQTSTAPFQLGDPTDPGYPDFTYHGDTQDYQVRVGKDFRQTINLNGADVFFADASDVDTNLLKRIMDLRDAVREGDTDKITSLLGSLDEDYERITMKQSTVGVRLEGLDRQKSALESIAVNRTDRLSEIEDADVAEVITRLQQKQVAYEAALRATTLIKDLNLAKFL
ncbi:MAG TPA: flagellin [Syntrophobacteraceae bacterium]|nr:flagellin [Syntrophobacteraceae bacterium]